GPGGSPAAGPGDSGSAAGTLAAGGGAVLPGDASAPPPGAGLGAGDGELQAAPNSTTPSELRKAKRIISSSSIWCADAQFIFSPRWLCDGSGYRRIRPRRL